MPKSQADQCLGFRAKCQLLRKLRNLLISIFFLIGLNASASINLVDSLKLWRDYSVPFGDEVEVLVYRPERPNGIGIVVCPGGSYYWLDRRGEGTDVAEWLCENGFTAFVLFYRTAGCAEFAFHTRLLFRGKRHPDMIMDAQRTLQYIWENAERYGVDRDKIGIMGFSAGGHLAMSTACYSATNFLEPVGIDSEFTRRPSFVAAIYPVVTMHPPYAHARSRRGVLGDKRQHRKSLRDSLSLERHIPANCPPVFLINCVDDPVVDFHNSVLLDSALSSKGIEHKYIQYQRGKHGFGVSSYNGSPECREWKNEFLKWIGQYYPLS